MNISENESLLIESIIDDYYKNVTIEKISSKFVINSQRLVRLLKSLYVIPSFPDNRKYKTDDYYFDEIDTEDKAYILGLLYADGTNSTDRNCVRLGLQESDAIILEKISLLFQPDRPLHTTKSEGVRKAIKTLYISSKRISLNLEKWGVVPAKTFKIEFPEWLDPTLHRHFIRGYFDGDGHVSSQLNIVGTEKFLKRIQEIAFSELGVEFNMYTRHPERNHNIRTIQSKGRENSLKF